MNVTRCDATLHSGLVVLSRCAQSLTRFRLHKETLLHFPSYFPRFSQPQKTATRSENKLQANDCRAERGEAEIDVWNSEVDVSGERERERDWGERAGDEAATVAAQQTRETNCGRIMEKRGWGLCCVVGCESESVL